VHESNDNLELKTKGTSYNQLRLSDLLHSSFQAYNLLFRLHVI